MTVYQFCAHILSLWFRLYFSLFLWHLDLFRVLLFFHILEGDTKS